MDLDQYPLHIPSNPTSFYGCNYCERRIRVYYVDSPILSSGHHRETLIESLRFYRSLPYPYAWYVYGEEASIVNILDLQAFEETHQYRPSYHNYQPPPPQEEAVDDVAAILQDLNMDRIMNESFQQAYDHVASSGLTKKQIYKNLRVKKYRQEEGEEESEICVMCQVEFEKNERVGVLQCKHRFHPECIKEWLLRKNLCPLCKHPAIDV